MGFFDDIQRAYGTDSAIILKYWANVNTKFAKLKSRRIFLSQCRRLGTVPTHVSNGLGNINTLLQQSEGHLGREISNFNKRLQHTILNMEISITHSSLVKLESELHLMENQLNLPLHIINGTSGRQSIPQEV
nr:unnamed protein product [Callosobruchus analis]